MSHLIRIALLWLVRHLLALALIIAVLWLGTLLKDEFQSFQSRTLALEKLRQERDEAIRYIDTTSQKSMGRVEAMREAPASAINHRISKIDQEIAELREVELRNPFSAGSISQVLLERAKANATIQVLEQEKQFLSDLRTLKETPHGPAVLEPLRQKYLKAGQQWRTNKQQQEELASGFPIASQLPGTAINRRLSNLRSREPTLYSEYEEALSRYQRQLEINKAMEKIRGTYAPSVTNVLASFQSAINDEEQALSGNWFTRASGPVSKIIRPALSILIAIILLPIGIKALFYFLLAPLASRLPATTLLPNASGHVEEFTSSVSQPVRLVDQQELLLQPEYIQSSSAHTAKTTKWLLNTKYPFTSLASGLVALTRIRTQSPETVVVSSSNDPLVEVATLSIPAGSAVVLHPRSLIGVGKGENEPVLITSHWRWAHLHAWLTLQFRYLVFHGPVTLLLKGRRGVRLEEATGRQVSQAATIGFSANTAYSTTRTETFFPYLTGKQPLLNDRFSGDGFYLYEEVPSRDKSGAVKGGIDGLTDSLLKVFGI